MSLNLALTAYIRKLALFSGFSIFYLCVHAQWSVLNTDPRLANLKGKHPLWQSFTKAEWNASNFASEANMKIFSDRRYGMFIHYGLSSYVNKDMSWPIVINHKSPDPGHGTYPDSAWQVTWPSQWKMEKFNAEEWVNIAKDAGMKYMVVIVKHHDGFHMWDTKYSNFKITNTPFGRDYLKELADACHKMNMPIGLYYSQRDWYHPDYAPVDTTTTVRTPEPPFYKAKPGQVAGPGSTHKKYIEYQYNVIRELLTNYGKIDIFWFDAAWYSDMFTASMWDSENLTRMIRQLQPNIVINNRASIPGDFDTPEQRIGMYQKRPWESAMTLNGVWAYNPIPPVKSTKTLIKEMLVAAAGNGNVLLSWGAKFNGEFDKAQKDTLLKIGQWLKKYGNTYYGTRGGPWMPSSKYGSVYKGNKVYLYVFDWKKEGLLLPSIPGNKVIATKYINISDKSKWKLLGNNIQISKPIISDDIVTILELTFKKPITSVLEEGSLSLFSDPSFGSIFLTKKIERTDWNNNEITIDLQQVKNVTGVRISETNVKVNVTTSVNGTNYTEAGETAENIKELPITSYLSGAYVPGRQSRYIKLKAAKKELLTISVYTK